MCHQSQGQNFSPSVNLLIKILITIALFPFLMNSSYSAVIGYGVFGGSTTTAPSNASNLNQDNPYALRWTRERFDENYFQHDTSNFDHEITIKAAGSYRVNLVIPLDEAMGAGRRSVRAEVYVNGSALDIGRAESGYIRDTSNHKSSSLHLNSLISNLNIGDVIEVRVSKQTSQSGDVVTPGAQLFLEYMKASTKAILLKGVDSTLGPSLNTSSEGSFLWDEMTIANSSFSHSTVTNAHEVTFNESGSYRVSFNIPLQDPSACSGNQRTSVKALVRLDGLLVNAGAATQGYIRCEDGHQFSSLHWAGYINGVSGGQKLRIGLVANTSSTATIKTPSGKKGSLFIEKVDSSSKQLSLMGTSLTTGQNWNQMSGGKVQWDTEQVKDANIYTHSTGSNSHQITFAESGDYLITYADFLRSTTQRVNPQVQLRLNNSLPKGGECRTHYIRNNNNHSESSCSLVYLLENVSSGDILEVSLSAGAANGTVHDSRPAELHIAQLSAGEPILDLANIPNKVIHFDMSNSANVLDSSNRNGNDLSFSGTVKTAVDISGGEFPHHALQGNSAMQPTFDQVTKVLSFDGVDDFFEIENADDINTTITTERTFAVVLRTGPDVSSRQMIYEEGGQIRGINVYIRNGSLYLGFWNDRNDGDGRQGFVSTNTSVLPNTNYYITMVYDYSNYTGATGPNGNLRGMINGVSFSFTGQTTSRLYSHSGAIGIGARNSGTCYDTGCTGGTGDNFQGDIFEFIMYNSAITSSLELEYFNYLSQKWPDPFPVTNLALAEQYTNDASTSPLITWNSSISTDIDHYEVAVGSTPGAADVQNYTNVGNVTSTTLTGLSLSECVSYYGAVKAVDSEPKASTVEATAFFKYDGTSPTDPSALVLTGGANSQLSKTLSWTSASDNCALERYEVALGTTSGASDIVSWTEVGTQLNHQFSGLTLSESTDYYMSVRAVDSAGNLSNEVSSPAWQLDSCVATDTQAPSDPAGLSVSGIGSAKSTPTLSWSESTDSCGLGHYELAIGTGIGSEDILAFGNIGISDNHRFTNLGVSLKTNTDYYFSLRAVDLADNKSNIMSSAPWRLAAPGAISSGLVLWLDGAESSSLFQNSDCSSNAVSADGDRVGCWLDKSSSGNHLTAAINGARPTYEVNEFNGNAVIRFDGNNDALDFSEITDMRTVFIVNKSNDNRYQPFFGHQNSTDWFTNDDSLLSSGASSFLTNGTWRVDRVNMANPQLATQSGQYSLYSVVSTGDVTADHIASDRKRSGRFFGGDLVEVIVYNRALDETEVFTVENYLYNKWFSNTPGPLTGLGLSSSFTNINNKSPTLSWSHSQEPDFDHYEVALGKSENSNDVAGWFNSGGNNSYHFNGTLLEECVDHFISVRAVDGSNLAGQSTSSQSFLYDGTAPTSPASLILSGSSSPSASKTLTWASATDSCSSLTYELSLGTSPSAQDIVAWTDVGSVNSYKFSGLSLSSSTDYFMNIRAKDAAGNYSVQVSSEAFQVSSCTLADSTAPLPPSGLNLSGAAGLNESPSFTWVSGSDSCAFSHHEVSLGSSIGGTQIANWRNIGASSSYQFTELATNLNFDTDYYFNIRSVDQAGNYSTTLTSSAWQLMGPASLSAASLALWIDIDNEKGLFRFDDCTENVITNNGSIGCVHDLSGNSNHLKVNLSANKPTLKKNSFNGKNSLYFDGGSNEYLELSNRLTNIRSVFWVLKEDTSNLGDQPPLLGDPVGGTTHFSRGATGGAFFNNANASSFVTGGSLRLNKVVVDGLSQAVPSSEAVISLVTNGSVSASAFTRDILGCCGNRTFGGKLAELIIYERVLNATEVAAVEDYLMAKWNLSSTTTEWLGTVDGDWHKSGNWSNGVPTSSLDCIIADRANDPVINSGVASCKNLSLSNGILTLQNGGGVDLKVYGNITIQTGTLISNDGEVIISDDGAASSLQALDFNDNTVNLTFSKSAGGTVLLKTSNSFSSFLMPSGSNFRFVVEDNVVATLVNGLAIEGGIFEVAEGGELSFNNGSILSLTGGIFTTTGLNDSLGSSGQDLNRKATLTSHNGRWSFVATGGVVSLTGFILNNLNYQGLQILGTANLSALDGGQFTNLHKDYSRPVKAITLNSSATLSAAIAVNVGFNWGSANTGFAGDPAPSDNYYTVYASNCGGGSLVFDQWFGDFWGSPDGLDTEDKIYDDADGGNCSVSMDIAVSPVTLTEFKATPYDQSIVIEWQTGAEFNHLGFNLYRSTDPESGYIQINNELIRNYLTNGEFRGRYRFIDPKLENDQVYYYILEDVALNGDREQYGPEFAIPKGGYGGIPGGGDSDVNTPIHDPGSLNLGAGVAILTRTQGSMRISITPGTLELTSSAWNDRYGDVNLPGYTKISDAGHPEVLSRKILIPVDKSYRSVQSTIFSQSNHDISSLLGARKITPAPSFTTSPDGRLIASYRENDFAYSQDLLAPPVYFKVNSSTVSLLGKDYIEIIVNPLRYNPVKNRLDKLDQIVLDIGLEGAAWDYEPPKDIYQVSPSLAEGTLNMEVHEEGIYSVSFHELVNENVEGPFANINIEDLRLYFEGREVPLKIESRDSLFNHGDRIIFYAPYRPSIYDNKNVLTLSTYDFNTGDGVSEEPLRISQRMAQSTDYQSLSVHNEEEIIINENRYAVFDVPVGPFSDHLFLKRIFTRNGDALTARSSFSKIVSMDNLSADAQMIRLSALVSSRGVLSENPDHHLKVAINGVDFESKIFKAKNPVAIIFDIPSSYFTQGDNRIELTVLGDQVKAGDFDMLDIEEIRLNYYADNLRMSSHQKYLGGMPGDKLLSFGHLGPSVEVFDITNPHGVFEYYDTYVDTFDGGNTYQVSFQNLENGYSDTLSKQIIVEERSYKSVDALKLNAGVGTILKDSRNEVDYLVIVHQNVISAAKRLVDYREGQGLRGLAITFDQVYGEFSHSVKSPFAIQKFLNFAKKNWAHFPQYLLLIDDGSYDPKDDLGWTGGEMNPVLLYKGTQNDFASDNALGLSSLRQDEEALFSNIAIGRLPSRDLTLVEGYVQKVMDYERGIRSPKENAKKALFISGENDKNENFYRDIGFLEETYLLSNKEFSSQIIDGNTLSSDDTKKALLKELEQSPLFVTYMGHGAEDLWGLNNFFDTSDAQELENRVLPIMFGLGCLNSYYYDPDLSWTSLAEELVFNPNGGAIAFYGSTTLTSPQSQVKLATESLGRLGQKLKTNQRDSRLGEVMTSALRVMGRSSIERDMSMSWTLFGDPALKLPEAAFSAAEPAPITATPRGQQPSKVGAGGCSAFAGEGEHQSPRLFDWLGFFLELIIYSMIYRSRKLLAEII